MKPKRLKATTYTGLTICDEIADDGHTVYTLYRQYTLIATMPTYNDAIFIMAAIQHLDGWTFTEGRPDAR